MHFYSKFIPYFEHWAAPLCALEKLGMTASVETLLTPDHESVKQELIEALVSDSWIALHDSKNPTYTLTDYSQFGFGYEIAQLSDNLESFAAMDYGILGGDCESFLAKSTLQLRSTGFGSRACHDKEGNLHSHIEEAFALDWAI